MQFEDPQDRATGYLILRHLYDGDVIEWPIADDHPLRHVFTALEAQGYIARWDRTWPLHDRYRLTDRGIATIKGVYKPAGADTIYNDLRRKNLGAAQRRAYLSQQGYDPVLWPLLHDPTTRWDRVRYDRGSYYDWFWDDQPTYHHHHHEQRADDAGYVRDPDVDDPTARDAAAAQRAVGAAPFVVDLDREAGSSGPGVRQSAIDRDVS